MPPNEGNQATPPPQNWEQTLGELDTPKINELSVGTVSKYIKHKIDEHQKTRITWTRQVILDIYQKAEDVNLDKI